MENNKEKNDLNLEIKKSEPVKMESISDFPQDNTGDRKSVV